MQVTTTYNKPNSKPFSWSFSKLKNFEVCPKRHYHIDIKKDVVEEESEMLAFGNKLHEALAKRLKDQTPLPTPYAEYETWAQKLEGPGKILVEQKLAITADYAPCTFFDKSAWYRGVADVIKIHKGAALALDWKTGKIKEDSVQLALMAACVFTHYPEVQRIRSEFVWLQFDATSRVDVTRADIVKLWVTLKPRIDQLKNAHDTNTFPPKQGGLCRKWCPVTQCQYHGGE